MNHLLNPEPANPEKTEIQGTLVEEINALRRRIQDDFDDSPESDEIDELLNEALDSLEDEFSEGKDEDEVLTAEENEQHARKITEVLSTICDIRVHSPEPEEEEKSYLHEVIGEAQQNRMRKMDPEKRRQYCADRAAENSRDYGNETGKFFAALAGARGKKPWEAGRELGEKIMRKRNCNYRGSKHTEGGHLS